MNSAHQRHVIITSAHCDARTVNIVRQKTTLRQMPHKPISQRTAFYDFRSRRPIMLSLLTLWHWLLHLNCIRKYHHWILEYWHVVMECLTLPIAYGDWPAEFCVSGDGSLIVRGYILLVSIRTTSVLTYTRLVIFFQINYTTLCPQFLLLVMVCDKHEIFTGDLG